MARCVMSARWPLAVAALAMALSAGPASFGDEAEPAAFCQAVRAAADAARERMIRTLAAPVEKSGGRAPGALSAPPPFQSCAQPVAGYPGACAIEDGPAGPAWTLVRSTAVNVAASQSRAWATEVADCFTSAGAAALTPDTPPWPAEQGGLAREGFLTADGAARLVVEARAFPSNDGGRGRGVITLTVEARDPARERVRENADGLIIP